MTKAKTWNFTFQKLLPEGNHVHPCLVPGGNVLGKKREFLINGPVSSNFTFWKAEYLFLFTWVRSPFSSLSYYWIFCHSLEVKKKILFLIVFTVSFCISRKKACLHFVGFSYLIFNDSLLLWILFSSCIFVLDFQPNGVFFVAQ